MVIFTLLSRAHLRAWFATSLIAAALLTVSSSASAQLAAHARCRPAVTERGLLAAGDTTRSFCFVLANAVVSELSAKAWLEQRDVQSSGSGSAAPAGTPAQPSAVPTVQPTPLASAALSAVAQDSGATLITAVSINPAMLFSSSSDPEVIARLSRLLDFTLFFPVDGLDQNQDRKLDYGGARLRINFTAASQASALQETVRQRLKAIVRNELTMVNQVEAVLLEAPDPVRCATQLMDDAAATEEITAACGAAVSTHVDDAAYIALRNAAAAAREEADARYFGLDLRFDTGDPSLGKIRNGAATALVGGVGFGRRFDPTATAASAGIRGRAALRYVSMRDTALTDWQLEGGIAFESARVMESQRLELSAGVEFRYSGNENAAEILRTRYAEARLGIIVPIAGTTGIAMSLSAPLIGDISPTLSFSGNWQQLLASAFPRR